MTDTTLTLALIPLFGLILNVVLFVVLRRMRPALNYLIAMMITFVLGLVPTLAWTVAELGDRLVSAEAASVFLLNFFAYASLGYCWFTVVNPCATAVRVRILSLALQAPSGVISRSAIREIYNAERMLDNRLGRLLAWRQIEPVSQSAGRYRAAPGAIFPALHVGITWLKRLVFGKAYRGQ